MSLKLSLFLQNEPATSGRINRGLIGGLVTVSILLLAVMIVGGVILRMMQKNPPKSKNVRHAKAEQNTYQKY